MNSSPLHDSPGTSRPLEAFQVVFVVLALSPDGYPSYAAYLIAVSIVPSVGFFRTVQPFINWRAFMFTGLFILLVSLLWEATLGVPYGWWGYRPEAMMGVTIGAWSGLPLEAVFVWLAVTYTSVIGYEAVKIWLAMGRRARSAFFAIGEAGSSSAADPRPPEAPARIP